MNRLNDIIKALDYIEDHIYEDMDCKQIARSVYISPYHFQRIFGIVCGVSLGEYVRRRKMTRAALNIINGESISDVALKYGYESTESFSRAFLRFHGVIPSKITEASANIYPRIIINNTSIIADRKIINKSEKVFVGFKKHFSGVPYGENRAEQENEFFRHTRGKQWLLIGASVKPTVDYCIITNIDENGYDFYIAYEIAEQTRNDLFDPVVMGFDSRALNLEILTIPKSSYAYYRTKKTINPLNEAFEIRKSAALNNALIFRDAPEIMAIHWRNSINKGLADKRYIEIFLPI